MFKRGRVYKRSKIHDKYGGQRQGGISTPRDYPIILLFTKGGGEEFRCKAGWTQEGAFLYTGEGQVGDMKFVRGNRALRDHIKEGKSVYLFEYVKKAYVEYIGEMICIGYEYRVSGDKNGDLRQTIVFQLCFVEEISSEIDDELAIEKTKKDKKCNDSLEELRGKATKSTADETTVLQRKSKMRQRSLAIEEYALKRANKVCEYCGDLAPFLQETGEPFLEVHHINKLSDGGPNFPERVAAICPNCHREAHYGQKREELNEELREKIEEKEQN